MAIDFTSVTWYLERIQDARLPHFLRGDLIPSEPVVRECDLCEIEDSLDTVLVLERPGQLPVPFLICSRCRRALDELHALLESAAASP